VKVENPLTREFVTDYPGEAARVLEQVSAGDVAALFVELPPAIGAPVLAVMLPKSAAACLEAMAESRAAELLAEVPVSAAARSYRLLAPAKQAAVSGKLPDKTRDRIHRFLEYPPASAGILLESRIDVLPENVTVADAMRRIERGGQPVNCEIYIVDNAGQLAGMIELGRLLTSSKHAVLRDIMNRKTQPVSVNAPVETLLSHPGWRKRRQLPVVERDNTLAGMLDYTSLQAAVAEAGGVVPRDPLENLLSLAGLYWLSVAQLLDSMLGLARPGKGRQH